MGLWTTLPGETYGKPDGTSFSSPFVVGVAGLILTVRSDLRQTDVECILKASADDRGPAGRDDEYGWGRLNALRAVQLAQTYTTCPLDRPVTIPAPVAAPTPTPLPSHNAATAFAPVSPILSTSEQVYFSETQHTLRGSFLRYWQHYGGIATFGYPISEEFVETGENGQPRTVQYFERQRFELRSDYAPPYNIQLSRLGDELLQARGQSWFTFDKGERQPDCLFFEETGHSLCGSFLAYWRSCGLEMDGVPGYSIDENLALSGQPLSEPQVEHTTTGDRTVQWFERARLEDHAGTVQAGLIGSELVQTSAWLAQRGLAPHE